MCPVETMQVTYPEWYVLERNTEKTIKKLTSLKDLSFYLRNPDEYIRRLAILRINELCLKDSIDALKEVMDEPMESTLNKELAAWTIKAVSLKWGIDLFISSKMLSRFSGSEKYNDLFKIVINDFLPTVNYDFSSTMMDSLLKTDDTSTRLGEGINLDMPFSLRDWFKSFTNDFTENSGKFLAILPVKLWGALKNLLILLALNIFVKLPRYIWGLTKNFFKNYKDRRNYHKKMKNYYGIPYSEKQSLGSLIKGGFIKLLYVIFFPLRFVLKHKLLSSVFLISLYCFFAYTAQGRIILYRNYGIDLKETQSTVYYSAKEVLSYAWDEFNEIAGISESTTPEESTASNEDKQVHDDPKPLKLLKVIAKNGLNLRSEPSADSKKVSIESLKYNDTITYLSESSTDSSGKDWYHVQTEDGRQGWVYSKLVKEVGGE